MEFLFRKLRAYKLKTSAVCVSKVLENSSSKDYSGVTFYRSSRYRLSSQITVLNSFLENFQGGLQAHLKKAPHGYVIGKFPKFLLHFVSRTNFITPTRLKLVKKQERIPNKIEAGKFKNKKIKITRWYIFLLKGYLKKSSEHCEIHFCDVIGCPFWVYNCKLLKSSIKIS